MQNKRCFSLIGLLVLIVLIPFTGCQKSEYGNVKPANHDQGSPVYANLVEQNAANSLNYLGTHHNQAHDYQADEDCIDSTESVRYDKVKTFMDDSLSGNHFLSFTETETEYEAFLGDTAGTRSGLIDLSTDYFPDYLKNNASLSSTVESYFEDLEDHYQQFSHYDSLVADIEGLESDVKSDSGLSDAQSDLLLGALAVARNDLAYWDDVRDDADHQREVIYEIAVTCHSNALNPRR